MPDLSGFFQDILFAALLVLRLICPLLAALIVWKAFSSLRHHRRNEQPLILLHNQVTRDNIPVMYWENSIGRSRNSDIVLADDTVSRDHAVLMRRDDGWLVSDTGSKSGVFVNNKKIKERTPVYPGDVIRVGATPLAVKTIDRPFKTKASWFFDRRGEKKSIRPSSLLMLVTILHFLMCIQICLGSGTFDYEPLIPFALLTVASWGFFLVSFKVLKRVSFELETLALFLSGTGIVLVSGVRISETYTQLAALALGMVLYCVLIRFMENADRVMRFRIVISLCAIGLLAVNLLLGVVRNGSKNWIVIGPVSIQPSEFVKLALIFVGASTLERLQTAKNLTEFIVFSAICIGALFWMGDFGTACIFFLTFLIISFMRSGDLRTIILICAAAVFGAFLILQFKPYIANRFAAWRHVWEYADSLGFQQSRVLMYAASGGFFGVGPGNGNLKYVAASTNDLVFGMMCEELGLLFALIAALSIAGLALYAWAGSSRTRSTFYSIASCSAGGLLVFQSCLNIFGATDLLPLTGVTLPFVSLGGSSMMAVWGLLAFIKASDERTYAARRKKA